MDSNELVAYYIMQSAVGDYGLCIYILLGDMVLLCSQLLGVTPGFTQF